MTTPDPWDRLRVRIQDHLQRLYPEFDTQQLTDAILEQMAYGESLTEVQAHVNLWDQQDVAVITYGDTFKQEDEAPLQTLHRFLRQHLSGVCSIVHILPFFPYSSDDGFAVINYVEVNQALGDWAGIEAIAAEFALMADLVINHCSSRSQWFENFKQRRDPGRDYFIEVDPATDLSAVVRPRTSPLLRETETLDGKRYVWCTFSHDQIDLDFRNPRVLLEFVGIIRHYLERGIALFRLDAVAFLWKEIGTPCINLPQTHEIIRMLRLLIEHKNPQAIIITETNIPNRENLSYFGNANEAHLIYNFTLPPLLLNTMLTGDCSLLKQWMMSMPPAQKGTTYFNFLASHDGIGLRPVEGILEDAEVDEIARLIQSFGGEVSWRSTGKGEHRPYELNIALIDACRGTLQGEDDYQLERFVCAHAIMLALEGIPAFYVHSLLATPNDRVKMELTSNNRAINRHNWDYPDLEAELADRNSLHARALAQLTRLIQIRKQQPAFHPNATQFTLHFGTSVFAFWRQDPDRSQSIFCLYNITTLPQEICLQDVNLIETDTWRNLISDEACSDLRETLTLAPYEFVWISNR